jgi:Sec-independent protein translocase protein TatA
MVVLGGLEWAIIGGIVIALIWLLPKKLPELARSIVEARREWRRAEKEDEFYRR